MEPWVRSLRMITALMRTALMGSAQYRASFMLDLLTGSISSLGIVLPLVFVYDHAQSVGGWVFHESLLVTGFFLILQGLVGFAVEPNLGAIVEGVRSGSLDYLVLKPVDAQLTASFTKIAPARLWDVVAGAIVLAWGLTGVAVPTPGAVGAAIALLGAGICGIYGLWLLAICASFWFVRVDNLRFLLSSALDAGRWPVHVYQGWIRLVLTVLLPVAMVTSFPAMALLGRLDWSLILHAAAVGAGFLLLSRVAWVMALRHYTSASS